MSKHNIGYVIYIYYTIMSDMYLQVYIEYTIYINYINTDFYNKSIRIISIVVKKGFYIMFA